MASLPRPSTQQILSLKSLYDALNGPSWVWHPISSYGIPWNFTQNANPCTDRWQGITCSCNSEPVSVIYAYYYYDDYVVNSTAHCNIIHIFLMNQNLTGTIPNSIYQLNALKNLHLSHNHLFGQIPSAVGQLQHLQILDVSNNFFTGLLPSTLLQLSRTLQILSFNDNSISGSIPSGIGNFSLLRFLFAHNNWLVGSLPPSLGSLSSLNYLDIRYNFLSQTIPTSIGAISSLWALNLASNQLTGPIPPLLFRPSLSQATQFDLSSNLLSGSIPSQISSVPGLSILSLGNNLLTGSVPSSLSSISSLSILLLHHNQLTSGSPSNQSFSFLDPSSQSLLSTLDMSYNALNGQIPAHLFHLPSLSSLAIMSNCFQGSLPDSLCQAQSLRYLVLDGLTSGDLCRSYFWPRGNAFGLDGSSVNNLMQGSIPTCAFSLPNLFELHLSGNGFQGSLDSTTALSPNLTVLSIAHNQLTGPLPPSFLHSQVLQLDASFNRFNGLINSLDCEGCSSGSEAAWTNTSRKLAVNRFSGAIPPSIQYSLNVSILEGNMFGSNCPEKPIHDPYFHSFVCGSIQFTKIFIFSSILVAVTCIVFFLSFFSYHRSNRSKAPTASLDIIELTAVQPSQSTSPSSTPVQTSSLPNFTPFPSYIKSRLHLIHSWLSVLPNSSPYSNIDSSPSLSDRSPPPSLHSIQGQQANEDEDFLEVKLFFLSALNLRQFLIAFSVFIFILFILLYFVVFSHFQTTSFRYGWATTAAFVSGTSPALILLVTWSLVLIFFRCFYLKYLLPFLKRNENDHDNLRSDVSIPPPPSNPPFPYPYPSTPFPLGSVLYYLFCLFTSKNFYCVIFLSFFNLLAVVPVNIFYVRYLTSPSFRSNFALLLNILFSSYKVFWNQLCLPFLADYLESRFEFHDLRSRSPSSIWLLTTFLLVLNSVLVPILAVIYSSPNCFHNVFYSPPPISAQYTYTYCPALLVDCDTLVTVSTTYPAPFIYSYHCSSIILQSYVDIYALMSCGLILFQASKLLVIALRSHTQPRSPPSDIQSLSCLAPTSYSSLHLIVDSRRILSRCHWSLMGRVYPLSLLDQSPLDAALFELKFPSVASSSSVSPPISKKNSVLHLNRLAGSVVSQLSILLTFGMACPPLALLIGFALSCQLLFFQANLGRFLQLYSLKKSEFSSFGVASSEGEPITSSLHLEKDQQPSEDLHISPSSPPETLRPHMVRILSLLAKDCRVSWFPLTRSLDFFSWLIILLSSAFASFFLFDMAADQGPDPAKGMKMVVIMNSIVWFMLITEIFIRNINYFIRQ